MCYFLALVLVSRTVFDIMGLYAMRLCDFDFVTAVLFKLTLTVTEKNKILLKL